MHNTRKRFTSILFVFSLLITSILGTSTVADAATKTYTIIYNSNGGTGSMANTIVTYGKNTKLSSNKFKRTGYTFTGWYAYRASDKKWYCKRSSDNTYKWLTANQLSQNKNYAKALYKNNATVAKTSSVNKDKVTMYAQWKQNKYTKSGNETLQPAILLNEHGWTSFELYYRYADKYTMNDTSVKYYYRSIYAYAKTERADWDNPYKFTCSNIYYVNSKGKKIQTFNMSNVKNNIFPGGTFGRVSRENSTAVTYNRKNNNYGQFTLSITTQYALNPFAKTIKYSLNA